MSDGSASKSVALCVGEAMSNAPSAARGKSVAVALVALCTQIWGWGYALVGGYLILVWADWLPGVLDDLLPGELHDLPNRITSMRITTTPVDYVRNEIFWVVFGILFVIFGIMANLATLGLYWRKPWGRIVTFLVAVLAISIVLVPICSEETFISPIQITANIPLQIAQVLYGILAFAVLSMSPGEPKGIYIVRLINFSVGLPLTLLFGMYSFDAVMLLFHPEPGFNADSRFAKLIIPSGLIAGSTLFASSLCLLIPGLKRPTTVVALMIAAVCAGGTDSVDALERFAGAQPWGAARGLFCLRLFSFLGGVVGADSAWFVVSDAASHPACVASRARTEAGGLNSVFMAGIGSLRLIPATARP